MKNFGYFLLGCFTGAVCALSIERKEGLKAAVRAGVSAGVEAYKEEETELV